MMSHTGLSQQHQVKPCASAGRSPQVGIATQAGKAFGFWESARETQKSIKFLKFEFLNKY